MSWTVFVMYLNGREVVESAPGELAAFTRRAELEAEGVALGAACLPPGSADLVPLLGRRLGSALAAWQARERVGEVERVDEDSYGDSGVQ